MFDLFRSREKTVRYLLGFILGLVALSMVITLIPGYSGGMFGGAKDQRVIAEIGDDVLTADEVRQTLTRQMRDNQIPRGMESVFVPMMIQSMVAERAVAYQAQKMGYTLNEKELAEAIANLLPQLFQDGKFVGRDVYANFLMQQNLTIPQFEANVRKQAASTRLESLALEGIIVSPAEVEAEFRRANDKVKISYFVMTPDRFNSQVSVSQEEIQAAYDSQKANLKTREKRGYLVFPVDEQAIAATIQMDEDRLKQYYGANIDRFRTPERVRVRHILLMTTNKPKDEVEKIRKRAEDLLKQVKSGGDFAALAQKNSEDPGSAAKGGDLDWVVRGQTVPEFEKPAFSMKPGQISDIVTTMYGFHILKVESKEEARVRPFDEVKNELRAEAARAQVYEKMQTLADQIHAALAANPAEAERIAVQNGITPLRVDPVNAGDPIPGVGADPEFQAAVSGLPVNGVTPVMTIGNNKLVIAKVTQVVPPQQMPLAEAANQIRNELVRTKAQRLFDDKVKEATERAKTAGGDLAALARQMGFDVKSPDAVSRTSNIEGLGTGVQLEQAFTANPGAIVGPVSASGGTAFVKVIEKLPTDLTQLAAQRGAITQQLKARRAQDRRDLFVDGIVSELTKGKKIKVYEENIKLLSSAFSG